MTELTINNVFKSGFRQLFRKDIIRRSKEIKDVLYGMFREVSNIIIDYDMLRIPDNLSYDTIYSGDVDFDYTEYIKTGAPAISGNSNMEDLMLALASFDKETLLLNTHYGYIDENKRDRIDMIYLDKNKLNNYGYDKFNIFDCNTPGCPSDDYGALTSEFILYNFIDTLRCKDIDDEEGYFGLLNKIFREWIEVEPYNIKFPGQKTIDTKLKTHIYEIVSKKFNNIDYDNMNFSIYYTVFDKSQKDYIIINLGSEVPEIKDDYNIHPLCYYITTLYSIINDDLEDYMDGNDPYSSYVLLKYTDMQLKWDKRVLPIYYK